MTGPTRTRGKPFAPQTPDAAQWCQRVGGYTALPSLILQLGGDPASTLIGAGLAPDALDHPEGRVPYAALDRLLRDAADRCGCPHFGLLAGRTWHVCDLGLVGELVLNSPTVGNALQTLTVHQHLNSEGGLAFLIVRGAWVDLGYAIYHPDIVGADQIYDAHLAAGFNFMRELCGSDWSPSEILVPHLKPRDAVHYRNLFKVHPHFNAEFCALRFPAAWLRNEVQGADAERRRAAEQQLAMAARPALLQQVYRALRLLLLADRHSGDAVAQMLSMHRRTLNRRLKDENTTFQAVLDQVRFDLARQLLSGSDIALDDIAASLGYAGVSPFMRTFHRWTGTTPGRWRRAARCTAARSLDPRCSDHRAAFGAPAVGRTTSRDARIRQPGR